MLTGKRVAVIGAGRSGLAAALVLQERGAEVAVFDRASAEALVAARQQLAEAGIPFYPNQDIPQPLTDYHLIVVSPGLPPSHPLFAEAERAGVPLWGEIELAYQIAQAPIIAITGTNGKTTSTVLTHHMLTALGYKAHLCGNVAGTAHDLPLVAAAHRAQPDEWLVAEVSSFQLLHTHQFRPHIAVITNITEDQRQNFAQPHPRRLGDSERPRQGHSPAPALAPEGRRFGNSRGGIGRACALLRP